MVDGMSLAREVIEKEATALAQLASRLDNSFLDAVDRLVAVEGRVLVTGVGKSGNIAQKVAGTLASTGTPAIFMHPTDALHGDLGVVGSGDLLLTLSKSGRTEELVRFVGHFRRLGRAVISICEDPASPIGELSDVVLRLPALEEAGPLSLAPTTSAVLQLALADALAMCLLARRGFTEAEFASNHPEGTLGKRLLLRSKDLMHCGTALPVVSGSVGLEELLLEITGKGLGMTCIVDAEDRFVGVFTDGDLRRLLGRERDPLSMRVEEAWRLSRREDGDVTVEKSSVTPETLAVDCLRIMRDSQISSLVVVDEERKPVGVVRLHDLISRGFS